VSTLLEVKELNKRFGGLHAVRNVSFVLQPGSITGVLGPNGAGKTTMFNLLTGFIRPDRGSVLFEGRSLDGLAPHQIVNRGLARTFQLARPFAGMSVVEARMAVLLVEQDARSALSIAERAYVLEHGRIVSEGTAGELVRDDGIRRTYLGL